MLIPVFSYESKGVVEMRKWVTRVVLVLAPFASLLPTDAAAQQWDWALRTGWTASTMSGSDRMGSESISAPTVGISAELWLNRDWGWEFATQYVQKGGEGTITNEVATSPGNPPPPEPTYTLQGTARLDYVEFSVAIAARLSLGKTTEARVFLGPSLGVLIRAQADGVLTSDSTHTEVDLDPSLQEVDFSGLLGASFAWEFKPDMTMLVEVRSLIGAVNINDSDIEGDLRTQVYEVLIGLELPITSMDAP
jgi:hypothetical protein